MPDPLPRQRRERCQRREPGTLREARELERVEHAHELAVDRRGQLGRRRARRVDAPHAGDELEQGARASRRRRRARSASRSASPSSASAVAAARREPRRRLRAACARDGAARAAPGSRPRSRQRRRSIPRRGVGCDRGRGADVEDRGAFGQVRAHRAAPRAELRPRAAGGARRPVRSSGISSQGRARSPTSRARTTQSRW